MEYRMTKFGRSLESVEDRTRGYPWFTLVVAALVPYVVVGTALTLGGAAASNSWLGPLSMLLAAGLGMGTVRYRNRKVQR
jgi:hypothetical protein